MGEEQVSAREHPAVVKYREHVNPAFVKLLGMFRYGRLLVRGRDVSVWDHAGREYLDCLACFGAANLGHNHPRLVARLKEYLDGDPLNLIHVGPSVHQGELAARLAGVAGEGLEVAAFGSSGAEAVEGGIKLARAATRRRGIVYCEGGFHGTSLGALSVMGQARMRKPFEPLLGDCVQVPFGDLEALEAALKPKTAAGFLVDPGLCEAGVLVPPEGYLAAAQELCRRTKTLFILDEVQTGLGRTGSLFAYEQEGFVPDILCLAKSLSGGIAPIGATLTSARIHNTVYGSTDRFDLHFSTFGGNGLSCTAGLATLDILEEEGLVENSRVRGQELLSGLRERLAGHPLVQDVRGRGLFVAIELGPTDAGWVNKLAPSLVKTVSRAVFGQWASVKLLERGILLQPASQHWNVLKVMPPLTLQPEHVTRIVNEIGGVLDEYQGVTSLMNDVSKRLGSQFLAGWAF